MLDVDLVTILRFGNIDNANIKSVVKSNPFTTLKKCMPKVSKDLKLTPLLCGFRL